MSINQIPYTIYSLPDTICRMPYTIYPMPCITYRIPYTTLCHILCTILDPPVYLDFWAPRLGPWPALRRASSAKLPRAGPLFQEEFSGRVWSPILWEFPLHPAVTPGRRERGPYLQKDDYRVSIPKRGCNSWVY